jgi:hypothetical protein
VTTVPADQITVHDDLIRSLAEPDDAEITQLDAQQSLPLPPRHRRDQNAKRLPRGATDLKAWCEAQLAKHDAYVVEHLEDMPEVRDWSLA